MGDCSDNVHAGSATSNDKTFIWVFIEILKKYILGAT